MTSRPRRRSRSAPSTSISADKRDAVLGALEMSGAQITALAVPAARRARNWQEGVRALYEAICAYFAAEPEMAQLVLVGVYGAGPRARARRDRVIDSLTAMLAPGLRGEPGGAGDERRGDRGDRLRADARAAAARGGRRACPRWCRWRPTSPWSASSAPSGRWPSPTARDAGPEAAQEADGGGMRSSSSAASAPR